MIAIEPLLRQPAVQAIGWALLQFLWQGAVIGALTALVLLALCRSAADVRYLVATIGLALMLTLPAVTAAQKWSAIRHATSAEAGAMVHNDEDRAATVGNVAITERPSRAASAPVASQDRSVPAVSVRSASVERVLPLIIGVWLAGVTLLSLRLLTGWIWIQRLRTHGTLPATEPLQRMAARLSRRLHIARTITLLESALVDVPTVVGWLKPVVLLPASALAGLSPEQLDAILAHELAHIRRHDYLVNLLQTLVETLLFYHPAVWWLSRRIRAERENCCDDLAVSLCGDPITYANALADLEALRGSAPLALAATGGSLLHRIRRVLGASTSHAGSGPTWLAGSVALVLIGGMVLGAEGVASAPGQTHTATSGSTTTPGVVSREQSAPQPVQTAAEEIGRAAAALAEEMTRAAATVSGAPSPASRAAVAQADAARAMAAIAQQGPDTARAGEAADAALRAQAEAMASLAPKLATVEDVLAAAGAAVAATGQSISSRQSGSSGSWVWSNNGEKIAVKYNGEIEFTDDDTDVRSISPGGSLEISDGAWLGRHTVEIRESGGSLQRRYWVNGSERPYDPDGRQWLHDNLPKFVRNTGIGAPRRVARYLKSGGPSAVLSEVGRIESSYVKRIYFTELFKQASLSAEQYRAAMAQAAREVRSDYELASLLISIADRLPDDEASRAAYFTAAAGISSDYELRRVYATMLKRGPVSPAVLAGILENSRTIDSDYEQSEMLRQIAAQQSLDDRTRPLFFRAAATIQSDYERHRVLSAVVKGRTLSATDLAEALTRAGEISSDYEAASFLMEVLQQNGIEGPARAPFFKVVSGLGSSFERGRVLKAVVSRSDASHDTLLAALHATTGMSGYELSQVLLAIASNHVLTGDLRDAYVDASDKLSGYEQGQVMTALVKSERRR